MPHVKVKVVRGKAVTVKIEPPQNQTVLGWQLWASRLRRAYGHDATLDFRKMELTYRELQKG